MGRPLVYIAGPYTKPDPVENTRRAIEVGEAIEHNLVTNVFIPHLSLLWHIVSPAPIERWYERDHAVLARCDALYRMEGESLGADMEVEFARERGIWVFTDMAEMELWRRRSDARLAH